jgi:hypothetical protein
VYLIIRAANSQHNNKGTVFVAQASRLRDWDQGLGNSESHAKALQGFISPHGGERQAFSDQTHKRSLHKSRPIAMSRL